MARCKTIILNLTNNDILSLTENGSDAKAKKKPSKIAYLWLGFFAALQRFNYGSGKCVK